MARKTPAKKTARPAPSRRKRTQKPSPSHDFAVKIVGILRDKLAADPVILDVRGLTSITDFFVIASGGNRPHVRALFEEVHQRLKQEGTACYTRTDDFESGWLVLDYVDVVVHLMLDDMRKHYAIEDLWARTPPTKSSRRAKSRRPAAPPA